MPIAFLKQASPGKLLCWILHWYKFIHKSTFNCNCRHNESKSELSQIWHCLTFTLPSATSLSKCPHLTQPPLHPQLKLHWRLWDHNCPNRLDHNLNKVKFCSYCSHTAIGMSRYKVPWNMSHKYKLKKIDDEVHLLVASITAIKLQRQKYLKGFGQGMESTDNLASWLLCQGT